MHPITRHNRKGKLCDNCDVVRLLNNIICETKKKKKRNATIFAIVITLLTTAFCLICGYDAICMSENLDYRAIYPFLTCIFSGSLGYIYAVKYESRKHEEIDKELSW